MTDTQIDYKSVFQNLPTPVVLFSPDFIMIDMNDAYPQLSGRPREKLVGQNVFEAFPDNPAEPGVSGVSALGDSLRRVMNTGQTEAMPLQRYDVEATDQPGKFSERYWCPINVPVRGPDGRVAYIIHAVEEVSDLIRKFVEAEAASG